MRKYLVKSIVNELKFGIASDKIANNFQKVCDELSGEGWILQEFHPVGQNHLSIVAVFYKDE